MGYIAVTHFTVTVTRYRFILKKGRLFGRIKWVPLRAVAVLIAVADFPHFFPFFPFFSFYPFDHYQPV